LERAPIRIRARSARITTPYQMLAPSSMTTLPMTVAVGATHALGATCGVWEPRGTITVTVHCRGARGCSQGMPPTDLHNRRGLTSVDSREVSDTCVIMVSISS
jgi:hypothetical protein